MSGTRHCGCTICKVECSLEGQLETLQGKEAYTTLLGTFPTLLCYPTAAFLLDHLRGLRHSNGSGEESDKIFRALREGLGTIGSVADTVLTLALVPALHATVSSFARACPRLDREDLSQQAIALFMAIVNSRDWRRHETHLAFSLARELRRSVSLWVQAELRQLPQLPNGSTPERSISAAELFERDVQLKHFLSRSLRTGALDKDDLNLLIDFKFEGRATERGNRPVSNAVRQRMKRLLAKMRRQASGHYS